MPLRRSLDSICHRFYKDVAPPVLPLPRWGKTSLKNNFSWTVFDRPRRVSCAKNNYALMGLTIHYTLAVKRGTTFCWLKNLLRRTQRLARKNGCAYVGKVLHSTESDPDAPSFFDCAPGNERRLHGGGRGTHGWLLEIWPGEGCETAVFGILQHRRKLPPKKGQAAWRTRYSKRSDWKLDAFCKTCYAAEHGLEHFVECHERVVRLLELWRGAGVRLWVHDEGAFWKTRSREILAAQIGDVESFRKMARNRVWG